MTFVTPVVKQLLEREIFVPKFMLYNHQINHSLTISLKQIIEIIKKPIIVYLDYVFYFKSRDTLNSDWEKIFTENVRMYPVL